VQKHKTYRKKSSRKIVTKTGKINRILLGIIFILIGFAWFAFIYKYPTIQTYSGDFAKEPIVADRAFEKTLEESDIKGIVIPRLNIDLSVASSEIKNGYWEVSETNASHGEGSANPGEDGNVVVFAHAREGLFLELRDIKKDDTVYILTKTRWYKYKVSEMYYVYPNDITTVSPTDSEILTLFTCSGFFDEKRLIVKAIPENSD
jgi:sortase A